MKCDHANVSIMHSCKGFAEVGLYGTNYKLYEIILILHLLLLNQVKCIKTPTSKVRF